MLIPLLFVLFSSHAQENNIQHYILKTGSFVPLDAEISEEIDLSHQFNPITEIQEASSCHIHAMSSYIERECRQLTGKPIYLSRSYLLFRHLKSRFKSTPMEELSDAYHYRELEGGNEIDTFERFKAGDVIHEKESPLKEKTLTQFTDSIFPIVDKINQDLIPSLQENIQFITKTCPKPEDFNDRFDEQKKLFSQKFQTKIINAIDEAFICSNPEKTKFDFDDFGLKISTRDSSIQDCIQRLSHHELMQMSASNEQIIQLLRNNTPVLWAADFINTINRKKTLLPLDHITTIVGYKKDKKTGSIEFLIRDSNHKEKNPFTVTGCYYIAFFKVVNESQGEMPPLPVFKN